MICEASLIFKNDIKWEELFEGPSCEQRSTQAPGACFCALTGLSTEAMF